MGLLSFFQRQANPPEQAPARGRKRASQAPSSADAVQQARTQARQRLIGATVLLTVGIIGFHLLFETQPRPIPVDIPIEVPRKDSVPPLALPPSRADTPATSSPAQPQVSTAASAAVITETAAELGREVPAPASAPVVAPVVAEAPAATAPKPVQEKASAPKASAERRAEATPAATDSKPTSTAATTAQEAARAKALLEGSTAGDAGRFVVQVGAFADSTAVREARQKVEKLGLKTYTQVVETEGGKRTRVRIGPFASRDEAQQAAAKLKSAGLGGAVLTL